MKLREWLWRNLRWRSREEKYFDRDYPLYRADASPHEPGNPLLDAGRSFKRCRTHHGKAVVYWDYDGPVRVLRAEQPNRRSFPCYGISKMRMRRREGRGWVHGTVVIEPDRVVFLDGELTPWSPVPHDGPSLETDLASDQAFIRQLQDDDFARAVYDGLRNRTFVHIDTAHEFLFSWRQAAAMIAGLRGIGERYVDFYPYEGFEGPSERLIELDASFLNICKRLGWRTSERSDYWTGRGLVAEA